MAEAVQTRFKSALGKPTKKDLGLVKQIVTDVGLEMAIRMAECLVWDWPAAKEKWRLHNDVPAPMELWMKRNDLAAAVTSGDGIITDIHRRSAWAAHERGEKEGDDDVWA